MLKIIRVSIRVSSTNDLLQTEISRHSDTGVHTCHVCVCEHVHHM